MTAHMQYQTPWKRGPWFGFNWRYDSGLVAGSVPCYGIFAFNDLPAIDHAQRATGHHHDKCRLESL